jgi:hypothetical protein
VQTLRAEVNGLKTARPNEPLDGGTIIIVMAKVTFRYEKFKQMLIEIETEYATPRGADY